MNPRSRTWCMTIPKHSTKDKKIAKDLFEERFLSYIVMGKETGKDGYKHYQCYLQTTRRVTFKTLKTHYPKPNLEESKGSAEKT